MNYEFSYELSFYSVEKYCFKSLVLGLSIDELLDGLVTHRKLFTNMINAGKDSDGEFVKIVADIDKVLAAYDC